MSEYAWEPTILQYYKEAIDADMAWGIAYEILQVERDNEGWHALILEWDDVSDKDDIGDGWCFVDEEAGLIMLDEQMFTSKSDAKRWLERRDQAQYEGAK